MTTTTIVYIVAAIAYHITSRQVGFLMWVLLYGEKYPEEGYWNRFGDHVKRVALHVPIIGEFAFVIWLLLKIIKTVFNGLEGVSNMTLLEDKLISTLEHRKLRREFDTDMYKKLAIQDPEAMRKALKEVGEL